MDSHRNPRIAQGHGETVGYSVVPPDTGPSDPRFRNLWVLDTATLVCRSPSFPFHRSLVRPTRGPPRATGHTGLHNVASSRVKRAHSRAHSHPLSLKHGVCRKGSSIPLSTTTAHAPLGETTVPHVGEHLLCQFECAGCSPILSSEARERSTRVLPSSYGPPGATHQWPPTELSAVPSASWNLRLVLRENVTEG